MARYTCTRSPKTAYSRSCHRSRTERKSKPCTAARGIACALRSHPASRSLCLLTDIMDVIRKGHYDTT